MASLYGTLARKQISKVRSLAHSEHLKNHDVDMECFYVVLTLITNITDDYLKKFNVREIY